MSQLADTTHVAGLIPDYVLELLPGDESDRVSDHLSRCADCRQVLKRERDLGLLVRDSLTVVANPDRARLRELMPRPPVERDRYGPLMSLKPGLVAATVLLLVICGTFVYYFAQHPAGWTFSQPTAWSTAVVITDTPTQTATREVAATVAQDGLYSPSSLVPSREGWHEAAQPEPDLVPIPAAPRLN